MSKHTPGPWFTKREGFSTVYVEARIGGGYLQEVAACGPTAAGIRQQDANASLIAAAPDLLEALICSVAAFEGDQIDEIESDYGLATAQRVDMARKAIAKAEGDAA